MKRLGLILFGWLASSSFALAATSGMNPDAADSGHGVIISTLGARAVPGMTGNIVDVAALSRFSDPMAEPHEPQADQGARPDRTRASLRVAPAGGNGIIHTGLLNRAIAPTGLGTSFDIVTGAFNDAGSHLPGWDFNFSIGVNLESTDLLVLGFNALADGQTGYAVDAGGHVALLNDGDVVGPDTQFSWSEAVPADLAWLAGTDGVLGVKFGCNGRLPNPVAGGICYGYIRIATTNTSGFPARIVEAAFDGDGQPITVVAITPANPPAASISPASLSLSVAANGVRSTAFTIANAAGSHPLMFAIAAQGEAAALQPSPGNLAKFGTASPSEALPTLSLPNASTPSSVVKSDTRGFAMGPWMSPIGTPYLHDDASYEYTIGLRDETETGFAAVWLNRFSLFEAQTINSVSILWPRQTEWGSLVGLQANIVAYYDADGDGNPNNAVRLGGDNLVTIDRLDTLETYATHFTVPGAGDVYIGFVDHWAMDGYHPALTAVAVDSDSLAGKSYFSGSNPFTGVHGGLDITNLANNEMTATITAGFQGFFSGNFMIRATGASGSCTGPALPWLTVATSNDAVVGGAGIDVVVKADPAAADLVPGSYTAELCVTTNDPANRVIAVPINLDVTAPLLVHACSHVGDGLFCDGFDAGGVLDDIVLSGLVNAEFPRTFDGMNFNFALGEWSTGVFHGDDFNPYWHFQQPFLMFHWRTEMLPGTNAGVALTPLGPYVVLRSGDTIGPDSTFSAVGDGTYGETMHFLSGVDGYLGFKFYNEETNQTNYGYMHLITTWPTGYPATLVDYGYNRAGGPITIP